jgi:hypothetical protein
MVIITNHAKVAVPPHNDAQDVFILQMSGTKAHLPPFHLYFTSLIYLYFPSILPLLYLYLPLFQRWVLYPPRIPLPDFSCGAGQGVGKDGEVLSPEDLGTPSHDVVLTPGIKPIFDAISTPFEHHLTSICLCLPLSYLHYTSI